jgi:radical SAM protein with 4Fe4S-binding SPASM domain
MKIHIPFASTLEMGQCWETHYFDNHLIYLNPEIPFWFVFPKSSFNKFLPVLKGKPLKDILKDLSKKEIENFAWQYNLFRQSKKQENSDHPFKPIIHFYATNNCNISCPHCYMDAKVSSGKSEKEIPLYKVRSYIEELITLSQNIDVINISGGEPLLRKGILDFCLWFKNRGIHINLLTNGTLISNANCNLIADAVNCIQVSLDGASSAMHDRIRGEGSFNKTLYSIILLSENRKLSVSVSIGVMKENIKDIYNNLSKLLSSIPKHVNIGFHKIKKFGRAEKSCNSSIQGHILDRLIQLVSDAGWKSPPILEPPKKLYGCGYGAILGINSFGDVFPCVFPFNSYGNIDRDPPSRILNKAKEITENNYVDNSDICRPCSFRYICAGRCRLDNFKIFHKLEPKCNRLKEKGIILGSIVETFQKQRRYLNLNG